MKKVKKVEVVIETIRDYGYIKTNLVGIYDSLEKAKDAMYNRIRSNFEDYLDDIRIGFKTSDYDSPEDEFEDWISDGFRSPFIWSNTNQNTDAEYCISIQSSAIE